ncbi:MAG: Ig-like domain-containing protein [Balneolales bacterium]
MQNLSVFTLFAIILFLGSCATPSQPTGGPRDTSGPEIVFNDPESGTVNFTDDRIIIEFSEYVDRSSFESAFRIEPDLNIDYKFNWGKRSVKVIFEQDLPDNTTIIFNIGTELTDTRRNNMPSPFQLALSTGPEIDTGKIEAVVMDAETGEPREGARVFLYRAPYDLTQKANYSVQADTSGLAMFNHLREGTYRGFWVDDRNRNQIWDSEREAAQPFPVDTLSLQKDGEQAFGTVFIARVDTTAPELLAVGLLSSTRMRLRFSENIQVKEDAELSVFTNDGELFSEAIPLYVDQTDPSILFAQSLTPFNEGVSYAIDLKGITDGSGNIAFTNLDSFPGSNVEDTTALGYIDHLTSIGVYADEPLVFQYSKLIDDDVIVDSLKVIQETEELAEWSDISIEENNLRVHPDSIWQPNITYEIMLWDPASAGYVTIEPVIWHQDNLGELEIIIENQDTDAASIRFSLQDENDNRVREGNFQNSVTISQLPPQIYKLIVYEDINDSGTWNQGQVQPYKAPEPYFIQNDVPVQPNMTGQVFINFGQENTPDVEM